MDKIYKKRLFKGLDKSNLQCSYSFANLLVLSSIIFSRRWFICWVISFLSGTFGQNTGAMLLSCATSECVPIVYPNKPWTAGHELVVQPKCDIPFGFETIPANKLRLDILFDFEVNLVEVCMSLYCVGSLTKL